MSSAKDGTKTSSTSSVLGHIIREYGLDKENDLNLAAAVGDVAAAGQDKKVVVEAVENAVAVAGGEFVTIIPPQVADADAEFVFNLIEQDAASPQQDQNLPGQDDLMVNVTLQPQQQQDIKQEPAEVPNPYNPPPALQAQERRPYRGAVRQKGEQIMANLTGFGSMQPTPASASPGGNVVTIDPGTGYAKDISVVVLEQPAENKLRFRYECEGRSAGALHGESSTNENKTAPAIQIVGYQGPAVCVVSLVEDKAPYKAHPHNIVGKDGHCKHGVCSVDINKSDMTYAFHNLGIQCVRRKDAPNSLNQRERIKVDPFKQGFKHKSGPIDLNCVRLCFQVFLKVPQPGSSNPKLIPVRPVVSNVVKDKKAHSDVSIVEYSQDRCSVEGGQKLLLFCEKVNKDDIEVHFTQYKKLPNGSLQEITVKGEFTPHDVHKQYGICLKVPPYADKTITQPVHCSMYLYKPKAKEQSDPVDFWYLPAATSPDAAAAAAAMVNGMQIKTEPKPDIKPVKRGREPKANPDDLSSGRINVPNKMAPTNNWGGGQVVTVPQQDQQQQDMYYGSPNNLNSPPQPYSPPQAVARSPYEQVTLAEGGVGLAMRPVMSPQQQMQPSPPGPQPPQATPVQMPPPMQPVQHRQQNDMTQELQELLRESGGQQQQQQMPNLNAYLSSPEAAANMGGAVFAAPDNVVGNSGGLTQLNIDSGDLGAMGKDLNNLSANLSSMEIKGGAQQQQGYARQSSQLDTPDVSMTVEDPSKRNNLNR